MNQKEAVFLAVKELRHGDVDTDNAIVLTKQEKAAVHQKLFDGFKKGRVAYNHEMPSDDKLQMYISGLVSNWLRKDKRLNGQHNYVPGRSMTRSSSLSNSFDEEQMEALRKLAGGAPGEEVQIFVVKRPAHPVPVSNIEDINKH